MIKPGFFLILILIGIISYAQGPPPPEEGDPDIPFDGGLSLLIAGGIGYGLKKMHDRKREKRQA